MIIDPDAPDGVIVLPRRASFWGAASIIVALCAQLVAAGIYVAKIDARFEAVEARVTAGFLERDAGDSRILKRGDDRFGHIIGRVEALERDRSVERDRLVRLEEQSRAANEILREIRQEMRGRR